MVKGARAGKRKRVSFSLEADSGVEVFVAGSFNNWDATKSRLELKDGLYQGYVVLPPGRYEYKFVVDGKWCVDPKCQQWVPNNMGSLNSVLTVS